MTVLRSALRACAITGSVLSSAAGGVLAAAPQWTARSFGIAEPEVAQLTTAFGTGVLLAVVAWLLRGPNRRVDYHAVRYHEPTEVRRPAPANLRPNVTRKVRAKVRKAAAKKVDRAKRA